MVEECNSLHSGGGTKTDDCCIYSYKMLQIASYCSNVTLSHPQIKRHCRYIYIYIYSRHSCLCIMLRILHHLAIYRNWNIYIYINIYYMYIYSIPTTTRLFNEIHYFSQVHEDPQYTVSSPVIQSALFSSPRLFVILVFSQLLAPAKKTSQFQSYCEIRNRNKKPMDQKAASLPNYNTKKLSPRILAAQMYLHKAVVDLRTKTLEGIFMAHFTLLVCYLTSPLCEQSICCKYSWTPCQWGALTLALICTCILKGFSFVTFDVRDFECYYGESMCY